MNVKDIKPNASIDLLEVEVVSKEEPREFTNFRGTGKVANVMVKDETGEVKLTLWNEQIDQVNVGSKITIENGWAKEYRGELQISTGKFGNLQVESGESGTNE